MAAPRDRPIAKRVVVYTQGLDPTKNFVGTGPEPGDLGFVGLLVPEDPTPDPRHRYLFRLVTVSVGEQFHARVVGIRQLLTICARVPTTERDQQEEPLPKDDTRPTVLLERQVITPTWTFPDGNVSWHLRIVQPKAVPDSPAPAVPPLGWSRDMYGYESALLSVRNPGVMAYYPPNNGVPPGDILMDWKDMRYPWYARGAHENLELDAYGPCKIILYASIYQTNPETRIAPELAPGSEMFTTDCGIEPEDRFWTAFPDTARYCRVGAELAVNFYPLDKLKRHLLCPETERSP